MSKRLKWKYFFKWKKYFLYVNISYGIVIYYIKIK